MTYKKRKLWEVVRCNEWAEVRAADRDWKKGILCIWDFISNYFVCKCVPIPELFHLWHDMVRVSNLSHPILILRFIYGFYKVRHSKKIINCLRCCLTSRWSKQNSRGCEQKVGETRKITIQDVAIPVPTLLFKFQVYYSFGSTKVWEHKVFFFLKLNCLWRFVLFISWAIAAEDWYEA